MFKNQSFIGIYVRFRRGYSSPFQSSSLTTPHDVARSSSAAQRRSSAVQRWNSTSGPGPGPELRGS